MDNNAAANPYFGPLLGIEEGAWDKTFEVNLKGAFAATRAVVEHLRSRKAPGAIVNLASVVGLRAAPLQGVYGMTKAALISMTRTLAQELGPEGIRVNAIAPGLVETRFAGTLVSNEALRDRFVSFTLVLGIGFLLFVSLAVSAGAQTPTIDQSLNLKSAGGPRISPDGRFIAYQVGETNWEENAFETEIWIAVPSTGERYQLTNAKKSSSAPQWSPDSRLVAFVSDRDGKRQNCI